MTDGEDNKVSGNKAGGVGEGGIYERVCMARDPIENGIGFAATRDLVSFLRYGGGEDDSEGEHDGFRNAFGYGVSQSGRYLKDLVYQGFNRDVMHRRVFDGILPVIPGSRRTSLDVQFSEAGRVSRQQQGPTF